MKARGTSRFLTVATIVIIVVGLGIAWYFSSSNTTSDAAAAVLLDLTGQPVLGSPEAPVAVVEFGDYKCPYCKAFHESVVPQLLSEYIETGKVKFSYFHFPFIGPDSTTAAIAAMAVYKQDPEAFWTFHDAIFARQGDERVRWATEEFLLNLAATVVPHIDRELMAEDLKSRELATAVRGSADLARSLGVTGTPTVFVNGVNISFRSYADIKAAIDQALLEAQREVDGGS